MYILSIESSCDETAAAVVDDSMQVHANIVYSQSDHALWRCIGTRIKSTHAIDGIYRKALRRGRYMGWFVGNCRYTWSRTGWFINCRRVSGKRYCNGHGKPLVGVHHMEGHIFSNYSATYRAAVSYIAGLGGHTELICVGGIARISSSVEPGTMLLEKHLTKWPNFWVYFLQTNLLPVAVLFQNSRKRRSEFIRFPRALDGHGF